MQEEELSPKELAKQLAAVFGTDQYEVTEDSFREILFIRIKGLDTYPEQKIEELAGPLLGEIESDFEEIILLNLE